MTKRNENRPGYKETQIGWFPEDWDIKLLGQIARIKSSNVDKKSYPDELKVFLCNYMDVFHNEYITSSLNFMVSTAKVEEIANYRLKKNDIVITKDSETREDIANTSVVIENIENLICGYHLSVIRPDPKITDSIYLAKLLTHGNFHKYFVTRANGVTRFGLTLKTLNDAIVLVPPLSEQRKIAEILRTWDKAIELVGRKIDAKRRLKKGLMQKLLFGNMRFAGYGNPALGDKLPEGWKQFKIGEVLKRERDPVRVNPRQEYQEIGIRSHGKGIFHKEKTTGAAIGNKSVFWVKPDCFIVNIVFAWEQAISKTTKTELGMIASHRFPMYKPKDSLLDLDYLLYFFQSSYGKHLLGLASPGGAGRNKTLGQETFRKLSIKLPPIEEQRKIGGVISACDKEIEILKKQKYFMRQQKQGLMQKLLTGEVRVKL